MKHFLTVTMVVAFAALLMRASAQVSNNSGKEFSVQILTSNGHLNADHKKFKGVADVKEEIFEGPIKYKYTTAHTKSLREASELKKKMTEAGFTDAFIVRYTNNQRDMPVNAGAVNNAAPAAGVVAPESDKNIKDWHPITERESIGYNTIK